MRVSKEQMAENRSSILAAAGRLFRAKGYHDVTVAEVMNTAGLTHGGFYRHFESKDDLIAQSLAHTLLKVDTGLMRDLRSYLGKYLSPVHRDNIEDSCLISCLAAETRSQSHAARIAMTEGLQAQIQYLSDAMPENNAKHKRRAAIGVCAAMVGAMILARTIDDPEFSDEVLKQTHDWIDASLFTSTKAN